MAILLSCPCGKQLRVNDEFAGRRVKCPECQNVIAVPTNGQGSAFTAAPPSKTGAKAGGVVRFACTCGKQMQARSEFAGKQTKCPGCGKSVVIPGSNEETVDFVEKSKLGNRPAPSGKRRLDDEDRDQDWDEDDRPRRRKPAAKGKRPMWPWVAGIAAVLVIGGGVGAWLLFFQGGKKSSEAAKGKPDKGQEGKAFADLALVPGDAMGFVTLRLGDWLKTPSGKEFEKALAQIPDLAAAEGKLGMKLADVDRVTLVIPADNPEDSSAIISTSKPLDEKKIVAEMKATETKVQGKSYYYSSGQGTAIHFAGPNLVLAAGKPAALQKILANPPRSSGPLSEKIQLAKDGKYHIVGAFAIPQALGQKLKLATAGGKGGQGPDLSPLAEVQAGTITAILGTDIQINMSFRFPDDARAINAKKTAEGFLALAKLFLPGVKAQITKTAGAQAAQATEVFNQVEQTLNSLKINQEGSTLSIPLNLKVNTGTVMSALLLPAVQKVRSAAERTVVINNMRQLGIAMHNYNDTYKHLPPAEFEGGLSWRVAILPFIEEGALYKEFHLNEPWDSPHNIKLLDKMPKVFAPPPRLAAKPGTTFLQVFTGPNAPFNGKVPPAIPRTFQDGTSNTILIVEAGEAVPWTKPQDVPYDPSKPVPRLGGMFPGNFFHAVMGDAAVIRLDRTRLQDATLRAAITPAGGEALGPDWWDAQ